MAGEIPSPSRLYLPLVEELPPTVLDYLLMRFPRMSRETWTERIERAAVTFADGRVVTATTPYRHGETVLYRREVPNEPPVAESETILFEDERVLVADKPHGMVVNPAGNDLERSLLVRLQRRTRNPELAPMHRLDRDTAGVILFSVERKTRAAYHQMFPEGRVEKEYEAVAYLLGQTDGGPWEISNRLRAASPWYRQQVVPGPVNAVTQIELVERGSERGVFRVRPLTGKQHQIRVHMAGLGFPIVGDALYPEERQRPVADGPMQLLARRLAFVDPISGQRREFESSRRLVRERL